MKHLKIFNEKIEEEFFKKLINWNLIQDAKDISLEYLDFNYNLYLNALGDDGGTLRVIFKIKYNHDVYYDNWILDDYNIKHFYNKPILIKYQIYVGKKNDNDKYIDIDNDRTNELLSILKEIYPEEIIYRRNQLRFN